MSSESSKTVSKIAGILMLLVYICVATSLLAPNFVGSYNMQNIVRWSALFGIIGIGVAFPIITGGIDLSIGSLIGLVGVLIPMLLIDEGWSVPATLTSVVSLALVLGAIHGLLITKVRLQPFVVTLCGLLIYRGVARWITRDQTQGFGTEYDDGLRLLATGKPCSVALILLLAGVVLLVWYGWRAIAADRDEQRQRGYLDYFGIGAGVILALIGSSRYWQGYEIVTASTAGGEPKVLFWGISSWSVVVPEAAESLPAEAMQLTSWLALPALIWLLVVAFRDSAKTGTRPSVILSTLGLLVTGALVFGAAALRTEDLAMFREQFRWPANMAAVFLALGMFMFAVAAFARASLRAGGTVARLPLAIASLASILALAGLTPLGQTLVPAPLIILAIIGVLAGIFLNQTIYGRYLLALGRNEEAARYSGINTDAMIILAYVICSGLAGVGGVLFALDGNSIQPSGHGNFYELYAIAAAVLGGCSLRGGEGTILGVIIGAAVMRILYNAINLLRIPSQLEFAIIGIVILIGVIADEMVRRYGARKKG